MTPLRSARTSQRRPRAAAGPDAAVFVAQAAGACSECAAPYVPAALVYHEGDRRLCLRCALLEDLELLPSGDVALTRRAQQRSRRHAVVLEWSRRGKRFERRGTLVTADAIRQARLECNADAAQRAAARAQAAVRRDGEDRAYVAAFVAAVRAQFPGCPLSEAREIAAHACEKHSGRVGRTAAAKKLDTEVVRLAVIAHVRHLHTDYDRIIARTRDKRGSRTRIKGTVESVLREWGCPLA